VKKYNDFKYLGIFLNVEYFNSKLFFSYFLGLENVTIITFFRSENALFIGVFKGLDKNIFFSVLVRFLISQSLKNFNKKE